MKNTSRQRKREDKELADGWRRFKKVPGLIGGTLDILFLDMSGEPVRRGKASALRGTIKKIRWTTKYRHLPFCIKSILLKDVKAYVPGTKSWKPYNLSSFELPYVGMGGNPEEHKGWYIFSPSISSPAAIVPKGLPVPSRHIMYRTRGQRKTDEENFNKLFEPIPKGKKKKGVYVRKQF